MKTSLLVGAAFAILGLAAAPLNAQTQTTTSTTSSSGYIQTSKIVGTKVKTAQGEEIGVVKDVVIDRSTGCMAYTVVSAGGTGTRITGQAKTVAVPWAVYSTTSDPSILTVTVDRDRIYNAPVFDYSRTTEYFTPGYIGNIYSYYGVSARAGSGVGVSGQTSATGAATSTTGATTTTGGTATTGASATPMAGGSPLGTPVPAYGASSAATATPATTRSPAASPSASVAASPRATTSPRATRGAGREERTTGRSKKGTSPTESPSEETTTGTSATGMSPAASPRHRGEGVREKAEESAAETAESPAGEGKKARRHRGEETAEPSARPKTTSEQE